MWPCPSEGARASGNGCRMRSWCAWRWRTVLTRANAQPALAFYAWNDPAGAYLPFALNVLSLRGGLVSDVTAFIVRSTDSRDPEAYVRFPEQPMDPQRLTAAFERFGLPERLCLP